MSEMTQAIERFKQWYENNKGKCKHPNYGPAVLEKKETYKQPLPSYVGDIYWPNTYKGD